MKCTLCNNAVVFLESIYHGPFFLEKDKPIGYRICFNCVREINTRVGERYRNNKWLVNDNVLVLNNKKELA